MPETYPILSRLVEATGPAADDALLRGIDLSAPDDQSVLVDAVIARNQPRGLLGLVARYHALPGSLRDRLRERAGELAAGIKAGIASDAHQTRANAIQLIAPGHCPSLAACAALAISDVDRGLADQAGAALLHFVQQCCEGKVDAQGRAHIVAAVRTAVAGYKTHRRAAPLECAVRVADDLADVLRPILDQANNETSAALQDMVCSSIRLSKSAAPFHYVALSAGASRNRFATRIGMTRDRALFAELVSQVDRVSDPEVARGLAAVRQVGFMKLPGWWEKLPDELAEKTARWIMAVGAEPADKVEWLTQMIVDGSSAQRQAARDLLCRWRSAESTEALRNLAGRTGNAASSLARAAHDELVRRGCVEGKASVAERLDHPDETVRAQAREQVAATAFEKFWTQYPRLPDEVREFAAGKLRRIVPDLIERLAGKLVDVDPAQRLQALRVADQCKLADALRHPLHQCCADADPRVRASAVRLLRDVPGGDSEAIAQQALDDADRRVRANAVEALECQRSSTAAASLIAMLDDADNRIRANAIKALMAMDLVSARDSLEQMLADPAAAHRLSALWVVEQSGWLRPAEQVLRLAQGDADRRVRARALRALGALRRLYRTSAAGQRNAGRAERQATAAVGRANDLTLRSPSSPDTSGDFGSRLNGGAAGAMGVGAMAPLLGDGLTRLRNVHDYLNRPTDDPWGSLLFWLIALAVGTAALLVGLRYARIQRRLQPPGKPWRLFRRLLREASVGWSARRQLRKLAARTSPQAPSAILLTPSVFAWAVRQAAGNDPAEQKRLAESLSPVAASLFETTGK